MNLKNLKPAPRFRVQPPRPTTAGAAFSLPPHFPRSSSSISDTKHCTMLIRVRIASLAAPLRSRLISTTETATATAAFLAQASQRRPTFSAFRSPTSVWQDRLRAQAVVHQQHRQRSPFVQQQYQRFVRQHPELLSSRRPTHGHYFAPGIKRTTRVQKKPAPSHLKAQLLKQNDPHATARRNSLLWSQRLLTAHVRPVCVRPIRCLRRRNSGQVTELASKHPRTKTHAVPYSVPKRLRARGINRFSRRRQI